MMKQTYLIQRLCPPRDRASGPFTFGGGLKDDGFAENSLELLSPIFSFDYMGAAEFEFGAVPEALQGLANVFNEGNGSAWSCIVNDREVYVLSAIDQRNDIIPLLKKLSERSIWLKEPSHFDEVVTGEKWAQERYIGWLELDNKFVFFTDKNAFDKIRTLFATFSNQPRWKT